MFFRNNQYVGINCTIYCIAVSCKEIINDLPTEEIQNKYNKPTWIINLENSNDRIRREIAHTQVVIECKNTKLHTKHQTSLLHRLKKKYENSKMIILTTKLNVLKQELKSKVQRRI